MGTWGILDLKKYKLILVAGARPNFMKIAPIVRALAVWGHDPDLMKLNRVMSPYVFLTLHRPSNVDNRESLAGIVSALNKIAENIPIIFPVHPRTAKMLKRYDCSLSDKIYQLPPLGFQESLYFWKDARLVMTDSGGLQEETTALGMPCLTLRENTERPVTGEPTGSHLKY